MAASSLGQLDNRFWLRLAFLNFVVAGAGIVRFLRDVMNQQRRFYRCSPLTASVFPMASGAPCSLFIKATENDAHFLSLFVLLSSDIIVASCRPALSAMPMRSIQWPFVISLCWNQQFFITLLQRQPDWMSHLKGPVQFSAFIVDKGTNTIV
ncbi:hypothetical protein I7I53_09762 [Histoplasma capsulatum var. duboisii H88]|uniref:Uncharacterized protein n=1 Tax=Ajellomyces capsulatus (strain H88) TaxID=544711 RepID=A0A8A1LBL9_AJEC8|nr:hypothetical protein I7I53_09762 [Histoplasma capsulatum var. duboisii H88]